MGIFGVVQVFRNHFLDVGQERVIRAPCLDVQLLLEHAKSADVCLVGIRICTGVCVHRPELAIPERNVVFAAGVGVLAWDWETHIRWLKSIAYVLPSTQRMWRSGGYAWVFGDMHPQIDHLVLEDSKVPEQSLANATVTVPILVVAATNVHNVVQQFEARIFDHRWIVIIDEMTIVEGNANAIEALNETYQALEVCSICISKEVVNQAVKEELSLFLAQDLGHGGSVLVFMPGITSNEVLEVQVTS
ncbi:cellulase, partial [Aureobasidium melanogenum]